MSKPQPKPLQNQLMDLLAIIGQAERHIEAAEGAHKNQEFHNSEAKQKLKIARETAVKIRDSRIIGKDEDE